MVAQETEVGLQEEPLVGAMLDLQLDTPMPDRSKRKPKKWHTEARSLNFFRIVFFKPFFSN